MSRQHLAISLATALAILASAPASALGFWTFDEPYWKRPVDLTSQASQPVRRAMARDQYDYLTNASPL